MLDSEHHWFYGVKRASAYATAEQLQQEFWWRGLYETHISCARAELPYVLHGYWKGHPFDIEFEPGKSVIYRADAELPWVIETITRSLRRGPSLRYQDDEDRYVFEWRMEGQAARQQALQGQPGTKHLERLDEKA
jgi:hypothetical protein